MSRISRRRFLHTTAAGSLAFAAPAIVRGRNLNNKLKLALIGVGGRGGAHFAAASQEHVSAICDVYEPTLARVGEKFTEAKKYVDFRKLYDDAKNFDAVIVSTCEHTHAFATLPALQLGKHVYCEKPLTHGIWESRVIREAAAKAKVATQMGIQIHASENYRRVVELIQTGAIGPVREVHVWVSRAWGWQGSAAEAEKNKDIVTVQDRPRETATIPAGLNWNLWLGPAPARPYHDVYFPGPKWYRWWDFGSGTMSDLGSHWNDLPFWALKLQAPRAIEASGPAVHPELAPASMQATYEYDARGEMPAVKFTWYQGVNKPPQWTDGTIPNWASGVLFVGDKGLLLSDYSKYKLLPEDKFSGFKPPEPFIARSPGQQLEWLECCKNGTQPSANFEYSGSLTEANHLGNVAYRLGKRIEWNAAELRCPNAPEAEALIRRAYRAPWKLA